MAEDRDYEAEAKEQGWDPNYDGDNKVDAQTFVEKGEKIAGIMKSRLDRQDVQIQKLQSDNKAYGEYQRTLLDKEKAKSASLLVDLESKRATAVTEADGTAFTQLDREIQQVREDLNAPEPRNGQEIDVVGQAWLMNNDWYNTNHKLQIYADAISDEIVQKGFIGGSPAYYEELTRTVKKDHPEEFKNKRQEQANTVELGGELEREDVTAHTYENLDGESKAACDRFVAGGFTTQDDYVANYDWE